MASTNATVPAPRDQRSRRIAVLSHCLLNANSKVEGLALYEGVHPLVVRLAELGIGVVQMPCPEMGACGMSREGQTREQYANPTFMAYCADLADDTLALVQEYQRCGYEIVGVVGVEQSPSCGVTRSSSLERADATAADPMRPGVHMEALLGRLQPLGVRFFAIDESVPGHGVEAVIEGLTEGR